MSKPLLVLGDFAWDVLIRTNSKLLPGGDTFGEVALAPGGSAANVAVWAGRCGLDTTFIGKIGRDRFGELAEENLREEGIRAHFIHTDAHLTAAVAVWIDETGERSMVSGQGADFYLLPSELPKRPLENTRHLHLSAWSFFSDPPRSAARQAAQVTKAAGATLSFDPGSFQMIAQMGAQRFIKYTHDLAIDIFFPNYEEGEALTGEKEPEAIARKLADIYPKAVIVLKLDAKGALVLESGQATHIPPATNNLIDATGAGDSFAGAYLARNLKGATTTEAANFATKVSAWVIEQLGARPPGDPRLKEIISVSA